LGFRDGVFAVAGLFVAGSAVAMLDCGGILKMPALSSSSGPLSVQRFPCDLSPSMMRLTARGAARATGCTEAKQGHGVRKIGTRKREVLRLKDRENSNR